MPETKEQTIARLQREVERLKASLSAATQRQNAAYRVYGPERDVHLARLTVLDDIIGNPRKLHAVTLCTAEQFDYILHRYTAWIKEHGDTTLFWDDDIRASDPGNRSRLYIRHSLLLSLMRKKGGTTQAELAAMFGVDQSNINRSLEASNHILSEVLPTARRMTQLIREVDTLTDLKRIIPPDPATGKVAVVLDGTHVRVDRSGDRDRRRADYSGKKKAFTFNTNILTDTRKRILWISGTALRQHPRSHAAQGGLAGPRDADPDHVPKRYTRAGPSGPVRGQGIPGHIRILSRHHHTAAGQAPPQLRQADRGADRR